MVKRSMVVGVVSLLCMGGSCTITIGPGDGGTARTYLDETTANIEISQVLGASQATVSATIVDDDGRAIEFEDDQSVEVNAVALQGPNAADMFTATVPAADVYVIRVDEPPRGIESTSVDAPGEFAITSPAEGGGASLAGFTLQWSGANARLQVRIRLTQTVFGKTEVVNLGPYTDTGSRELTLDDLDRFVQGADLVVTLTKINAVNTVGGFQAGTATARLSSEHTLSPRP